MSEEDKEADLTAEEEEEDHNSVEQAALAERFRNDVRDLCEECNEEAPEGYVFALVGVYSNIDDGGRLHSIKTVVRLFHKEYDAVLTEYELAIMQFNATLRDMYGEGFIERIQQTEHLKDFVNMYYETTVSDELILREQPGEGKITVEMMDALKAYVGKANYWSTMFKSDILIVKIV